ncbi:MAG: dienelactone hydrolase family protein [Pseudomonadota bacterium]
MSTTSKWIDLSAADGSFGAYLALPHTGKGPGIVLLQEIFGVNAHIRSVADQYAADGYVVLVPDLFWRSAPRIELGYDEAGWKKAVELLKASDLTKAQADIAVTVQALRALPELNGKVASLGFCWGGMLSYNTAANGLVDAAIAYYGGGIQEQLDRADEIKIPLQMHFGGQDSHIPNDAVRAIARRFEENQEVEVFIYPEGEHGFNCSHRSSYNQRAAALSHGNSLVFLGEHM